MLHCFAATAVPGERRLLKKGLMRVHAVIVRLGWYNHQSRVPGGVFNIFNKYTGTTGLTSCYHNNREFAFD